MPNSNVFTKAGRESDSLRERACVWTGSIHLDSEFNLIGLLCYIVHRHLKETHSLDHISPQISPL